MKWNWMSREEWAAHRRTVWDGMENPQPATSRLTAYASPAEIESAIAAMKALLTATRRAERDAERALGVLGRQPGESARAYNRRFREMTHEERETVLAGPVTMFV
jgi:ABC-type ATPase with predicted acetyltransferase domain